jgi:glutamate dehydrogenase/leucine dehydrogenase
VSGSGNVAQYAALKLLEYGATVLTMSDSTGYVYEPNGFTKEQIEQVRRGGEGELGGTLGGVWSHCADHV